MDKLFSVAIDGPAGAGKSTIAKAAAKALGFVYRPMIIAQYCPRRHLSDGGVAYHHAGDRSQGYGSCAGAAGRCEY